MTPIRKILAGGTIVAATLGGGALGAALVNTGAGAAETTSTTTAAATDSTATPQDRPAGPHQANGITEKELTGDDAEKAKAAALEAVPGATVNRVETDADGATYEAHVTKADGTCATVLMDENFKVTSVEEGGPGGHGGPRGAQAPAQ